MEITIDSYLLTAPSIDIKIDRNYGADYMHFIFRGHLSYDACNKAIRAWSTKFDRDNRQYKMIWDCQDMVSYDHKARNEWVTTLTRYGDRIDSIYVVSNSLWIRGTAILMNKLSRYNLRVFRSFEDLNADLRLHEKSEIA